MYSARLDPVSGGKVGIFLIFIIFIIISSFKINIDITTLDTYKSDMIIITRSALSKVDEQPHAYYIENTEHEEFEVSKEIYDNVEISVTCQVVVEESNKYTYPKITKLECLK